MIAILKRELRSLCHSMYGILFFGLFLFACGIFMSVFHFSYGYGNFEFVLSYMTVALLLLLPLLSVPLFYFEARQGTDRLLESLPISRTSVLAL